MIGMAAALTNAGTVQFRSDVKMRSLSLLIGIGFLGVSALQGCVSSVDDGSETLGSASEAVSACYTNSGLNPTKAALAVAMADELGRWDPAHDLVAVQGSGTGAWPNMWTTVVQLSSS